MSTEESRRKTAATRRARTEANIFNAIQTLSKTHGIYGWSLKDVATEAGISVSGLMKHYPSLFELQQEAAKRSEQCPTCGHLTIPPTR